VRVVRSEGETFHIGCSLFGIERDRFAVTSKALRHEE
jgi:hypothetical protein